MKKMKKLLIAILITGVVTASLSGVAFAAEAESTVQPLQETLTYETNNATDVNSDTTTTTETEVTDLTVTNEELSEDALSNVPDGYEIYFDEQGEPYYVEKEPVEPVIEDVVDETEPEEVEEEKPSYSEKDLRLLASLIYSEARGQSYDGMLAVANVVLNRAKSDIYSHVDTIKEVIYDRKWSVQFAVTIKSKKTGLSIMDKALKAYDTGKFSGPNPEAQKKAMNKAIKAAKAALQGKNNIGNYLCFNTINSSIKKKFSDYKIIGDHIFYRTK